MTLYLLGLLVLMLGVVIIVKPDIATMVVMFLVYTNAAVVGYRYHGVPFPVAASATLGFALPLAHYVVIQHRGLRWNPVLLPMYFLLCAQLLSAMFSDYQTRALTQVIFFAIEGVLLYFLITNVFR